MRKLFSALIIMGILITSSFCLADTESLNVIYEDYKFTINDKYTIDIRDSISDILTGYEYTQSKFILEGTQTDYYSLNIIPVKIGVSYLGDKMDSIDFISEYVNGNVNLRIYDLQIIRETKISELKDYFSKNNIKFSCNKISNPTTIETDFTYFSYKDGLIKEIIFNLHYLRMYGNTPYWLNKPQK